MPIQLAAWELPAASCHATWGSYASTVLSALSAESNPPMAKILHSAIIYTHLFTLTFTLTPMSITLKLAFTLTHSHSFTLTLYTHSGEYNTQMEECKGLHHIMSVIPSVILSVRLLRKCVVF